MVDAGSFEANLGGKLLPFLGDAPFGSNHDLMFSRHTLGYTIFFAFGLCSKVAVYTVGVWLGTKATGLVAEAMVEKAAADFQAETKGEGKMLDEVTKLTILWPARARPFYINIFYSRMSRLRKLKKMPWPTCAARLRSAYPPIPI